MGLRRRFLEEVTPVLKPEGWGEGSSWGGEDRADRTLPETETTLESNGQGWLCLALSASISQDLFNFPQRELSS